MDLITPWFGAESWQAAEAGLEVAEVERYGHLTAKERQRLALAGQLRQQVEDLARQKKFAEAKVKARQVLEIYQEILGKDNHPVTQGPGLPGLVARRRR